MADIQKIVGACIRFFREQGGLSQETLAQKAGISYQYLSGMETGKENFSLQVLAQVAGALQVPVRVLVSTAYDNAAGNKPPVIEPAFLRRHVPLPQGMSHDHLLATLNLTQAVVHRLNRNMLAESGKLLQDLIQHNNFSGLVSNLLGNSFAQCSPYQHNHHQRYPDLVNPRANGGKGEGLEVKTTLNIGKGGESHNGHDGWHVIACYNFLSNGDIRFVHVMFASLNGHRHRQPDWKYLGSVVNEETGSRRTETFVTNLVGTTKLRDGSAYLDTSVVNFSRWRQERHGARPKFSLWADDGKETSARRKR